MDVLKKIAKGFLSAKDGKTEDMIKYRGVKPKDLVKLDVDALSSLFPYRMYDKNREVYINQSSVMQVFELPLLSGANPELIKDMVASFNKHLSTELYCRIFRLTHQCLGDRVDAICHEYAKLGGIYAQFAQKQREYLNYVMAKGYHNKSGRNITLMDSRIFFEFSLKSHAGNQDEKIELLKNITAEMMTDMATSNVGMIPIPETEFLAINRMFMQFDEDHHYLDRAYDPYETLQDQLRAPDRHYFVKEDMMIHVQSRDGVMDIDDPENIAVTSYQVERYPNQHALWQSADYLAHVDKFAAVTCPHIFFVAFRLTAQDQAKSRAGHKKRALAKSANSKLASLMPTLKDQANEWNFISEGLEREEIRLCDVIISMSIFSKQGHHKMERSRFEGNMRASGFTVRADMMLQAPLYLASFPGMMAEGYWNDLKILRAQKTLSTWNLVNLLPIVGDWKGAPTGLIVPGMRNQLAAIDNFSPAMGIDNYNICLAAGPGAGKTALMQTVIMQVLATNGYVFVIDKGHSYRKMCGMLGGIYLDSTNIQLNPFTYLDAKADKETLNNAFTSIADLFSSLVEPNKELDAVSKEYLRAAAQMAFVKAGNNAKVDHVVESLGEIAEKIKAERGEADGRVYDLMTMLTAFKTDGGHHSIFNDASRLDPKARFIVMELNGFEGNTPLLRTVLFALLNVVSQRMYFSDRNSKKMCIVDEAWSLLKGDGNKAAGAIENGYRTVRRHNGSFVTIVHGVDDYFSNEYSQACWKASDIKIIMRQNPSAFKTFVTNNPEVFSRYEQHILSQFQAAADSGFSSLMLKAGDNTTFHRLFIDPHMRITISSKADHFQMVEDLQRKGGYDLWNAINRTAIHFFGDELSQIESYNLKLKAREKKENKENKEKEAVPHAA